MRERKFRYRWARTFEGATNDYTCWDGSACIGRVYRHDSGPESVWMWHMSDDHPEKFLISASGSEATRDSACHALERAYDRER